MVKSVYELNRKEMVQELNDVDPQFIKNYLVLACGFEWQDVKSPTQRVGLDNMIRDLLKADRVLCSKVWSE